MPSQGSSPQNEPKERTEQVGSVPRPRGAFPPREERECLGARYVAGQLAANHSIKRRVGEGLRTRTPERRQAECLCILLIHNIHRLIHFHYEAGIVPDFNAAAREISRTPKVFTCEKQVPESMLRGMRLGRRDLERFGTSREPQVADFPGRFCVARLVSPGMIALISASFAAGLGGKLVQRRIDGHFRVGFSAHNGLARVIVDVKDLNGSWRIPHA